MGSRYCRHSVDNPSLACLTVVVDSMELMHLVIRHFTYHECGYICVVDVLACVLERFWFFELADGIV